MRFLTVSLLLLGPNVQDRLLHFENLLAWEAKIVDSSADDGAKSIVCGIVENFFHVSISVADLIKSAYSLSLINSD